jgi:FKBP-type peptidyl-prolyl cis-trans isomerase FkpA
MSHKLVFSFFATLLLVAGCSTEGRRSKTDTGYEYEVVRKGSGEAIPANSYIFFHMERMIDDSLLQSTATTGRPGVLKLMDDQNYGPLKPLVDLMASLHEGDSILFYMPLDSFERRPPGFENTSGVFTYRVGIFDVKNEEEFKVYTDSIQQELDAKRQVVKDRLPEIEAFKEQTYAAYKSGQLDSQMKATDSGLRYIIHEEGDGPVPQLNEQISVHYYGYLDSNGKMFDTSFRGGQPYQYPLGGQVIQGWNEALGMFKRGTKATVFIPAALGYGAAGQGADIPENADLIFYLELEK